MLKFIEPCLKKIYINECGYYIIADLEFILLTFNM